MKTSDSYIVNRFPYVFKRDKKEGLLSHDIASITNKKDVEFEEESP
jgi:hypothetical protein